MRIVFCDDQVEILDQLTKMVASFFQKYAKVPIEYAAYTSGDELLVREQTVDIAFLDVEMPGTSGIYAGAELMKRDPHTKIFIITSYPDYLDEAMRFRVFRYLSKPIDQNRLFRNLKDAMNIYALETKEIAVETDRETVIVRAEDILCIEAAGRTTVVYTTDKTFYSVHNIAYWQKELASLSCFYPSHRSYIVNMKYIAAFDKLTIRLQYQEQTINAYLAQRKYAEFKSYYMMYRESVQ